MGNTRTRLAPPHEIVTSELWVHEWLGYIDIIPSAADVNTSISVCSIYLYKLCLYNERCTGTSDAKYL
jgi:hypothetical protein